MESKICRAEYLLRAKRTDYQVRERQLFSFLRRELNERCYVSFSAGKDSAVLAHACHSVMPGIPILMTDPGCPVHWTEQERQAWLDFAGMAGWNLRLFAWDKYAVARPTASAAAYRRSVHADQFSALSEWAREHGLSRRVMGLRREESRTRANVSASTANTLCPLSSWPVESVWCYLVSRGVPWLTIYDHLGPDARNGLIGRNGEARGRLAYLRQHFPEAYRTAREIFATVPQEANQ